MKVTIFALFVLIFSFESFAQRRHDHGGRYDRMDRDDRRGSVVIRPDRVVIRPNRNTRIVIGPRYTPNRSYSRVIRDQRRTSYIRDYGYTCDFGSMYLNGRMIHNFYYNNDCHEALRDLRAYGDFCDGADMFDSVGRMEGQFSSNYECIDALGYYY
ncbi:MAG TPA: hypothetical protein VNJ01_17330 [Bacteriovoracaceae bacterium]|nr:hypothetical protein [Bacteriovoracaceae bacterium]